MVGTLNYCLVKEQRLAPRACEGGVAEHSEAGGSLYEFAVNAGNRRYILQYSPSHRPVGGASPLINAGAKASIPLLS